MRKMDQKRSKRIKKLILTCALSTILLSAATYAWFTGLQNVNVNSFDVEIASTESLLLSLNGSKWGTDVTINKANLDTVSYTNHKNSWGGEGLLPMSSNGQMDSDSSRMILFEKASLTPTPGGYRLLASQIDNSSNGGTEHKGYVAFDLFIRNTTGSQYIAALDAKDEEAIYLTTDSAVTVAADGVANTGIENSVRVAFAQIGRVAGTTTDASVITGITCTDTANVTGICRTAQIWEPNDKDHVINAIRWYNTSCMKRLATGLDVTKIASYNGSCSTVADGTSYSTYAIRDEISNGDNIDVYDGYYNTYVPTQETLGENEVWKLNPYAFFKDTDKELTGTSRPQFMSLAPSSITKVRVYIYIEGQDIDNYDFASIGKKISIKFGFTKERFNEADIEYDGPALTSGVCTGGTVVLPTTQLACQNALGTWTPNGEDSGTCALGANTTQSYCESIGGVFVENAITGTCTDGTAPDNEISCTTSFGAWSNDACTGNTKRYCDIIGGVFTPPAQGSGD